MERLSKSRLLISLVGLALSAAGCDGTSSGDSTSTNAAIQESSGNGACQSNSNSAVSSFCASSSWQSMAKGYAHIPRTGYWNTGFATYWTGQKIITWGDVVQDNITNAGEIYDPATNSWSSMSTTNAPAARTDFVSAFTGSELLVWGGMIPSLYNAYSFNDGGAYNLTTGTWSKISHTHAPSSRFGALSVWTGSKLIVWGGQPNFSNTTFVDGGVYDRLTDTWSAMSLANAPSPRHYTSAVWTGKEMIVWGGVDLNDPFNPLATGARYNPTTNTWTPISTVGAPSGRSAHTAVWTGSKMIIWGGYDGYAQPYPNFRSDSAEYDPTTDTWTTLSSANAPSGRVANGAVWTGSRMIIWGGWDYENFYDSGYSYDPSQNKWEKLTDRGATPNPRAQPTLLWTGQALYVLGGTTLLSLNSDAGSVLGVQTLTAPTTTANAPLGPQILSSPWTPVAMPSGNGWAATVFGNGLFVALKRGLSAVSSDGFNWTSYPWPNSDVMSLAYGDGHYVSVSRLESNAQVSYDGINWTSHSMGLAKSWTKIAYGNGRFVAVSDGANSGYLASAAATAVSTDDGVTWTQTPFPVANISALTFGNGKFVALTSNPSSALTSTDGTHWTSQSLPFSDSWQDITYGNGFYLALAHSPAGTTTIATSPDGVIWNKGAISSSQAWGRIAFGNGKFVALSFMGNTSAVSSDGITWDLAITPADTYGINNLVYGNGIFAAFTTGAVNGLSGCMTATF